MSAKRPPSPSGLYIGDKPVTDWPTIRTWVLKRDGHLCQTCKVSVAAEVDHVWPRRLGGPDHIGNLRAICGSCNKAKGGRVDILAASVDQLRTGTSALATRIRTLELEQNEIASEWMKRAIAHGDEAATREVLASLAVAASARESDLAGWRDVVERAFRPKTVNEIVSELIEAVRRIVALDPKEVAKRLSYEELAQLTEACEEAVAWMKNVVVAWEAKNGPLPTKGIETVPPEWAEVHSSAEADEVAR